MYSVLYHIITSSRVASGGSFRCLRPWPRLYYIGVGSILDGMTAAVENAATVVVCLSQRYKESPNCKTEAEYAHRLGKNILPVRMQQSYQPDGWLGLIVGNRYAYDFSTDEKYKVSVRNLIRELGDRGKASEEIELKSTKSSAKLKKEQPENKISEAFADTGYNDARLADSNSPDEETTNEESDDAIERQIMFTMISLSSADDFLSKEVIEQLRSLNKAYSRGSPEEDSKSRKVGDLLASMGVTDMFLTIWNKYFEMEFLNNGNVAMEEVMTSILYVLWDFTDISSSLCQEVFQSGIPTFILCCLQSDYLHPSKTSEDPYQEVVTALISILFNMLQKVPESSNALREQKAVEVLQQFRDSPDGDISCVALFVQGYIINEDENEILYSNDTNFLFIKNLLEIALKPGNTSRRAYRFAAAELISALNRLAVNDNNKTRIVNAGLLPLYVQLLQPGYSEEEQAAAAEGLWTLAFKCKREVENEPGCIAALGSLAKEGSENVKHLAQGTLWTLAKFKGNKKYHSQVSMSGKQEGRHVFISYQWDSKPIIRRLVSSLRNAGFQVWVDFDNMIGVGSILDGMAAAVENAAIVVVCLSQRYKESPNCKTEAEYTHRLGKNILPVRMQQSYQPDGWLGLIVGNRYAYDFSSDEKFKESVRNLIRELGDRGKASEEIDPLPFSGHWLQFPDNPKEIRTVGNPNWHTIFKSDAVDHPVSEVGQITKESLSTVHTSKEDHNSNYATWSTEELASWLQRNNLEEFREWFRDIDGKLLKEYKSLRKDAPETFFSMLKDKHSLKSILGLSATLKEL